jgi:hypothetical protein
MMEKQSGVHDNKERSIARSLLLCIIISRILLLPLICAAAGRIYHAANRVNGATVQVCFTSVVLWSVRKYTHT